MAVEESAKAPPAISATAGVKPSSHINAATGSPVSSTCSGPAPNTTRRSASTLGIENSRPRENSKKTMPNSARCSMPSVSPTQPRPPGPARMPALR